MERKSITKTDICMFVWNYFLYDARVYKECRSLSQDGYRVRLLCLQHGKAPFLPEVEQMDGFEICRVKKGIFFGRYNLLSKKVSALLLVPYLIGAGLCHLLTPWLTFSLLSFVVLCFSLHLPKHLLNLTAILRMIAIGRKSDAAIYHANDLNTMPQAWICSKWRVHKRKLVYDSHEVQTSRTGYGKLIYPLEKFFITKADLRFSENEMRSAYTSELYRIEPPIPLHNYADYYDATVQCENKVDLHGLLGIDSSLPICLYQGGIQAGRGLEQLIEAVPMMDRCAVVFIGEGRIRPSLQAMVKERHLEHRVFFLPMVPREQLKYYTMNAYLGFQVLRDVCFNHRSALSNKISEYSMAGVPVIASDFPSIAHYVAENKTGLLVNPEQPMSIAQAVNLLLEEPELRQKFAENALLVSRKLNWEQEEAVLLTPYHSLLTPSVTKQPSI